MYRRATREEREQHAKNCGLYPLHAYVKSADSHILAIEDLRAPGNLSDPQWEVLAPDYYHFRWEFGLFSHSFLGMTLAECRDFARSAVLELCDEECREDVLVMEVKDPIKDLPGDLESFAGWPCQIEWVHDWTMTINAYCDSDFREGMEQDFLCMTHEGMHPSDVYNVLPDPMDIHAVY